MQLIDQLVSLGGASATAPGQSSEAAQAEQAALFQLDLEALEQGAPPAPALPEPAAQGQPPEPSEVEVAITPPLPESRKTEEPKGGEPFAQTTLVSNIPTPPVPQQSDGQPQPAAVGSAAPTDIPRSDSHTSQPPAQLATSLNPTEPKQAALPQPPLIASARAQQKEPSNLPQAIAKPEAAVVQAPTPSVAQNALAQAEMPRRLDAPSQPSQQDVTPVMLHPGAVRKDAAGRETAPTAQANLMKPQPTITMRQEVPNPLPAPAPAQSAAPAAPQMVAQSSVQPDTYAPQKTIESPAAIPSIAPAAAKDLRPPARVDTPIRDAAPRTTTTPPNIQAGASTVVQATQTPLSILPITGKEMADPEPLVALSPLQPSSPLSPSSPVIVQTATPAQTSYAVHQISAQIAAEAGAASGRDIEVRLDPEELGRVRITVHPREAGLFIALAVERPETLDLLRKNAEELMSNLQDFDLSGATLEFSQDSDSPSSDAEHDSPKEDPIQFSATPQATGAPPPGDGRLDLRL